MIISENEIDNPYHGGGMSTTTKCKVDKWLHTLNTVFD
jgi:hypothetical protein